MVLAYDLVVFLALLLFLVWINGVVLHVRSSQRFETYFQLDKLPSKAQARINGSQPYRTAFHFQPLKNWMNDPNGPLLHKGIYHLFYQYNPDDAVWGNIAWGHSTSEDLVNWTPQPIALSPSIPSDINGCWSGSVTLLPGEKPAILYTGDLPNLQVQNLALPVNSSDPYLKKWIKNPKNPLIVPTPANKVEVGEFRDPTTAWLLSDGLWRMVVGSKLGDRGTAVLFRSRDFIDWSIAEQPLYSVEDSGMWECPDFFPVYVNKYVGAKTSNVGSDVRHVLKASLSATAHDCYMIGTYDTVKDVFVPDDDQFLFGSGSTLRYDYGKFYASKSFYDADKKRRVLWAWVNESSTREDDIIKGWSGIQALPRSVLLDKSGKQLVQWPIEEIESLRTKRVDLASKVIEGGSVIEVLDVTAAQADVEVLFSISDFSKAEKFDPVWTDPQLLCSQKGSSNEGGIGPFGLLILASKDLEEYTSVFFLIFKSEKKGFVVLMCSDQSRSSLNPTTDKTIYGTFMNVNASEEDIWLRSLIDHSVIESFGAKGKSCITSRVYPTIAIDNDAHLYVFNNGSETVQIKEFRAWSMNKARVG